MKIAALMARVLLGLLFLVFGLNGFLHFIPMAPPPGLAGQYMGALFLSHYIVAVFLLQVVGGVLLLANRFVPLALVLLGPVVVNILSAGKSLRSSGTGSARPSAGEHPLVPCADGSGRSAGGAVLYGALGDSVLCGTECLCGFAGAAGGGVKETGAYLFALRAWMGAFPGFADSWLFLGL